MRSRCDGCSITRGQAKPVLLLLYPFAVIGGVLAAYGWYLFIVAVILPFIAEMGGAD